MNQWLSLGFPLGGLGGVGLWFRGWGLNWWHWALVSGLGLESVAGGVAVVAWVEIWRRGLAAISVSLNQWLSQWLWVAAGVGVVAWVE